MNHTPGSRAGTPLQPIINGRLLRHNTELRPPCDHKVRKTGCEAVEGRPPHLGHDVKLAGRRLDDGDVHGLRAVRDA